MNKISYIEQLKKAEQHNIWATELMIAENIQIMTLYQNEEFEEVCAIVRDTYLKTTNIDIPYCARAIVTLHTTYELEEIWRMDSWERISTYREEFL